jgi:hypothetical protein
MIMVASGTVIAFWCVFTFVFIGKGTRLRNATARQAPNSETVAAGKKLAEGAAKF